MDSFIDTLRAAKFFDDGARVTVARAPGRLDVMGGIADYSGSLVLQRTIAEATFAAAQRTSKAVIEVSSVGRPVFRLDLSTLDPENDSLDYERVRSLFLRNEKDRWAAYVVGVFPILMRERGISFNEGAKIFISSNVPEGKGVASSAALEVASMQAVTGAFGIELKPEEIALLCQKVENRIAGAPCGIMDQMTAVCGAEDSLLALLCQPAKLEQPVRVPEETGLWGIDSGERHSVGGSDYVSVRTGAFIGLRIISEMTGDLHGGYLARVSPSEFEREFLQRLPEEIRGDEFVARYKETADAVTQVDPGRTYKVRQPAAHPVYEHHRVQTFRQLLAAPSSEERRRSLGELMYQSHESYSACGLGSSGTDRIVSLVKSEGPANGLYGARITGGGSGGTVAILGRSDAGSAISRVVEKYEAAAGRRSFVFRGSSPGAASFGSVAITV
jgi:L-arabinokinase